MAPGFFSICISNTLSYISLCCRWLCVCVVGGGGLCIVGCLAVSLVSTQYFPSGATGKESACNAGDPRGAGLIPGSGSSPGGGNGNPFQYSCLENPMDRGASWATVHETTKSHTQLSDWTHTCTHKHWSLPIRCCTTSLLRQSKMFPDIVKLPPCWEPLFGTKSPYHLTANPISALTSSFLFPGSLRLQRRVYVSIRWVNIGTVLRKVPCI